jgi:hypothetical protein
VLQTRLYARRCGQQRKGCMEFDRFAQGRSQSDRCGTLDQPFGSSTPVRMGSRKRPASSMKAVSASDRLRPMGAIEKMLSLGRPACCKAWLAMRKAGAPLIVIIMPREVAKDKGISSFDFFFSTAR